MVSDDELARRIQRAEEGSQDGEGGGVEARLSRLEANATEIHDELARRVAGKADDDDLEEVADAIGELSERLTALESLEERVSNLESRLD